MQDRMPGGRHRWWAIWERQVKDYMAWKIGDLKTFLGYELSYLT